MAKRKANGAGRAPVKEGAAAAAAGSVGGDDARRDSDDDDDPRTPSRLPLAGVFGSLPGSATVMSSGTTP